MKILITGSDGVIGRILVSGLAGSHEITGFDLPDHDAREYEHLVEHMRGHDAVIHLAWNTKADNYRSDFHHPDNAHQVFNVYSAAAEAGVPRVIMASSVHADRFTGRELPGLLKPYDLPLPDSPYGAGKCFMEALGRYYARDKNLKVFCIRFGGVNPRNQPPEQPESERQVWLSHEDCLSLIQACLRAETIPDNYAIIYAVSENRGKLHDTVNTVGWTPQPPRQPIAA